MRIRGIELSITRKPIKNLYIRVLPQTGEVHVSAPVTMTDERIAAFANQRYGWIVQQRERILRARRLGMQRPGIQNLNDGDQGFAWTPQRRDQAAQAINERLPLLLTDWTRIIGRQPTHITLRPMSSRWGSCTPRTGRIRLNLQLGLMEPKFLEYVLVHEMTHLWASGHGAEFQRRMTAYLPAWRSIRRELNQQVIW